MVVRMFPYASHTCASSSHGGGINPRVEFPLPCTILYLGEKRASTSRSTSEEAKPSLSPAAWKREQNDPPGSPAPPGRHRPSSIPQQAAASCPTKDLVSRGSLMPPPPR